MKDWNDMTPDERVVGVLTKVLGWSPLPSHEIWKWVAGDGIPWMHDKLPPILTSADACIEHVGKAVEEKGLAWDYSSLYKRASIFEYVQDHRGKSPFAHVSTGNGDLATALAEAAYRMATEGEEG